MDDPCSYVPREGPPALELVLGPRPRRGSLGLAPAAQRIRVGACFLDDENEGALDAGSTFGDDRGTGGDAPDPRRDDRRAVLVRKVLRKFPRLDNGLRRA